MCSCNAAAVNLAPQKVSTGFLHGWRRDSACIYCESASLTDAWNTRRERRKPMRMIPVFHRCHLLAIHICRHHVAYRCQLATAGVDSHRFSKEGAVGVARLQAPRRLHSRATRLSSWL